MAEQASLLGRAERRAGSELARAADVVEERGGEQEVGAEARVELRSLAAERRDADRVLEQPAGVAVVAVGAGRGKRPQSAAGPARRGRTSRRRPARPGCVISAARNSRKPSSSSASRRSAASARRDRRPRAASTARTWTWSRPPKRSTRPSTRTASPSPKRGSSSSTSFQTRASIRPLASTSSSARYGGAGARAPALLLRDRVDALDGPVLGELGDRGHAGESRAESPVVRSPRWPTSQPFRAVRYAGAAGSLADLVAPPVRRRRRRGARASCTRAARTTSST